MTRSRIRVPVLARAAATLLLVGAASGASARPMLDHASPAAGSIVARSPARVSLSFSEVLVPSGSDAVVRNATGGVVSAGKARVVDNKAQLEVPVSSLPAGKYKVEWYATSPDKRHNQGSFTFVVGSDASAARASARSHKSRAR
jgi:copper transport protein